jgi:transglutaminase-like putative cysteine protease
VLRRRHGVCQDFAHLQIGCLRALGLAARYVSGYLLTRPPPGRPRLQGADASHAWIAVYVPGAGWIPFDPTNDLIPADEHVTVAQGRDFTDVAPLRGVILGGGRHTLTVAVDVEPV